MSALTQSLYAVPVVGWLAKDAVRGRPDAKYYFAFNVAAILAVLVYSIGYPFVICVALAATGCALAALVILTAFDVFGAPPADTVDPRARRRSARQA